MNPEPELYRINETTITVNGKPIEVYVPEVFYTEPEWVAGEYISILSPGSFIYRNSQNPTRLCTACHGDGCKDCRNGFRKGEPVDQKDIAQMFIDIHKRNNG